MIILTVNSGSTSVKLAAYSAGRDTERLPLLNERYPDSEIEPRNALGVFLAKLPAPPDAVVHRVVHGGTRFTLPVRIDDAVVTAIGQLAELAPLHNPHALKWIAAAKDLCGAQVVQVAAFDTAFFADLPAVAAQYAVPARIGVELGVRRYGFHGLAHESMWRRWCELNPELPRGGRLITLQLGGGCSIAAIDRGRAVDTSMGFSPLEGLVMATRSGDIDPAVIPYLQRRLALTAEQILELLNCESGLAGLSGTSGDPQVLLTDSAPQSQFAVEMYCYRIRKYIGAYLAVLGGCDGIAFGGGVGEHVPGVRERVLADMRWAGIELEVSKNAAARGGEARIDTAIGSGIGAGHAVAVYVLAVDEESALLRAAEAVLKAR